MKLREVCHCSRV